MPDHTNIYEPENSYDGFFVLVPLVILVIGIVAWLYVYYYRALNSGATARFLPIAAMCALTGDDLRKLCGRTPTDTAASTHNNPAYQPLQPQQPQQYQGYQQQ